ncbi:MAG TPA: class I SAM-dependent methyltransferase [Acidimicrobiales bacterium]|nr:class I SAM-dependent methyltransferase [Acidimicrobiales bacterium]
MNPTAAATLARFDGESRGTRLHTRVRWRSCPFEAVAETIPKSGRILEIGCGHGLFSTYLALESADRRVLGIDVDGNKIRAAQRAAEGLGNLTFRAHDPGVFPEGPWDAVAIVDVLYLIDREGERGLLTTAAQQLAPRAVLAVKEMATRPRWKFRWMAVQERLSVQVLKITDGHDLTFVPPEELATWMGEAGLTEIEHRSLDGGHLHPHHLVTARKPSAPG